MADDSFLKELLAETDVRMQKSVDSLRHDLTTIRTGRANPSLLERVEVEYYGAMLPLQQVATVTAPEARLLVVTPFDKSAIPAIDKGIRRADLGLNPSSDGIVLRLPIPQLTEETRKNLIRMVHRRVEEGKVAIRNIRRETIEDLRDLKKSGEIGEDDEKRTEEHVQKLTDKYVHEMDGVQQTKEHELMEV